MPQLAEAHPRISRLVSEKDCGLACCTLSGLGFSIGKLFWWRARYMCDTRMCQKLAHNASLTLAGLVFESATLALEGTITAAVADAKLFQRSCQAALAVPPTLLPAILSAVWLAFDLVTSHGFAPGTAALALAVLALCLAACLIMIASGVGCVLACTSFLEQAPIDPHPRHSSWTSSDIASYPAEGWWGGVGVPVQREARGEGRGEAEEGGGGGGRGGLQEEEGEGGRGEEEGEGGGRRRRESLTALTVEEPRPRASLCFL